MEIGCCWRLSVGSQLGSGTGILPVVLAVRPGPNMGKMPMPLDPISGILESIADGRPYDQILATTESLKSLLGPVVP